MKKIVLNIFTLALAWVLYQPPTELQATIVEIDENIMVKILASDPNLDHHLVMKDVKKLMKELDANPDQSKRPNILKRGDIAWTDSYSDAFGQGFKDIEKLTVWLKKQQTKEGKIAVILDFAEGWNDGARCAAGEYNRKQVIEFFLNSNARSQSGWFNPAYALGVNLAYTKQARTQFPWVDPNKKSESPEWLKNLGVSEKQMPTTPITPVDKSKEDWNQ